MGREPWHLSDNPRRLSSGAFRHVAAWVIGLAVVIGVIGGGGYLIKVAIAEPKGAADQHLITNSGKNRIAAQEAFEALYAQIQTYDRQLDQAAKDVIAYPNDPFFATNYSGLVKQCQDAVGQYNADARKVTRAKWLTDDLPFEIDQTDTRFDCKENSTR